MALLQTKGLTKVFGGLCAVDQLDLDVLDSEILGLVGPNGAGKTTVFNMISGFCAPTEGSVVFKGENITNLSADKIARRGIGRIFQASTLFKESTVFNNVLTGLHMHYKEPGWKAFLHARSYMDEERGMLQKVEGILEWMGLITLRNELARNLPHGYQRTLAICIALATTPKLILLDEPLTGMNATEITVMIDRIKQIRERGVTLILVEHNMSAVMGVCDRIVVLNYGRKIAHGLPHEIRENKEVIEAYLGREEGGG